MAEKSEEVIRIVSGRTYYVTIDDSERRAATARAVGEALDEVFWGIIKWWGGFVLFVFLLTALAHAV